MKHATRASDQDITRGIILHICTFNIQKKISINLNHLQIHRCYQSSVLCWIWGYTCLPHRTWKDGSESLPADDEEEKLLIKEQHDVL